MKLMMEAVMDVAIWGVTYSLNGSNSSIHQIISQLHRENYEHRQTVHDHADHRRYDQQNLQQKHQTDRYFKKSKK